MEKQCFWSSSTQNHAETFGNYFKNQPKVGLRSCPDLLVDELRNTREIYGKCLGNMYGTHEECIRNIHKYL